ncbi:hypothetical protein COLO4_09005 [Corchorus olitorius]|uniref:Uncharacterized protein n=1 Tax=Corchorus olitorius TaxID=93759 RepID=A0A1R3KDL3_9ROSI|nr:hypothetical protein COLO4_09005 [Corchorus olitorius]
MAEYAARPSCMKLHLPRSFLKHRGFLRPNSSFRTPQSKSSYRSCNLFWMSRWRNWKVHDPFISNFNVNPCFRETSSRSASMWSLVDSESITASGLSWIPVGDQVLLMASIFLTYLAGAIPVQRSGSTSQMNIADDNAFPKSSTSSGSSGKRDSEQDNLKQAWDAVRQKLLDTLDAIERGSDFRNGVLDEQQNAKRPLSLYAVSEGPKIRLLWASLQQLEKEAGTFSIISLSAIYFDCLVKNFSGTYDTGSVDDWLLAFSRIIQKCCKSVCFAWLEKELGPETNNMELVSLITEKLNGDDAVLQNIRKSGKENLYAELLYFLSFGSVRYHPPLAEYLCQQPKDLYLRKGCCYDQSLFTLYGDSILEDLVITLADGIANTYLELISVDGNLSDEVNALGLAICNLSTRALQRLRNETGVLVLGLINELIEHLVALNQWLYQNLEAIASMYEDRFDLYTLKNQPIKEKSSDNAEKNSWWKKFTLRKHKSASPSVCYVVISHFSMPVKRTKELRALTGWRYYFSLFLELSDIGMPMVRAIIDKVSNAISFFLVCLIGRSLGLIYTGIRQSLRWK